MKRKFGMVAAVVLLSGLTGAYADTLSWTNTAGGSFQTAANWKPNAVPGMTDIAKFSSNGTYTVTLAENTEVAGLDAAGGTFGLTLDLNGYSLTTSNSASGTFNVGTAAAAIDLTVKSSAPGGEFNLFRILWNNVAAASGNVLITGSNTSVNVTRDSTSDNFVGNFGSNSTFTVSGGAHFKASKTLIFGIGTYTPYIGVPILSPKATLTVTDPGTTFTNGLSCMIGKAGTNMPTLVVSNGASFVCTSSVNAGQGGDTGQSYSPLANGKVVVTGTNSYLEATAITAGSRAGEFGTAGSTAGGYFVVEKGGSMKLSSYLEFGNGIIQNVTWGFATNLFAYGEAIVRNPGSSMYVAGNLTAGVAANGAIHVLDGGTLTSGSTSILYLGYGIAGSPVLTNDNAYGLLVVSNENSSVTLRGLRCGYIAGYGDVIVADKARLSVTNYGVNAMVELSKRSRLTVSDAFVETYNLTAASNATVRVELGSRDPASAYIQLTNNLKLDAHTELEVGVLDNATLSAGDTVTLLTYTGTRTGTFKDLPEGADFFADGYRFRIYYGDGSNDAVTLKYLPLGTMIRIL